MSVQESQVQGAMNGTQQVKRVTRSSVNLNVNVKENGNVKKASQKGEKRSISENHLDRNGKRAALGDISNVSNAIQQHADRISLARKKKLSTAKLTVGSKPGRTSRNMKRSNRLKASQSHASLPQFSICIDAPVDGESKDTIEKTIAEQCDEILESSSTSVDSEEMKVEEMDATPALPEGVLPYDLDDDPNVVSEYADSIFKNMRVRESNYPVADYLSHDGSLTTGMMRAILVDWLVEVQENFELFHETLYVAVKLIDVYLQNNRTPKEQLQLVGSTALLIACKVEERQPPPLDDFQFICDDAYSHAQFMQMELKIFKALSFDINIPISYRFLRRFSRVTTTKMEVLTLARYILELSLHPAAFVTQPSSRMAAACLCLAMKMKECSWNVNFSYHSCYEESELTDVVIKLNQMLLDAPDSKLQTVRTKYSHPIFFEVAKTKPLAPNSLS